MLLMKFNPSDHTFSDVENKVTGAGLFNQVPLPPPMHAPEDVRLSEK